MTTYTIHDVLDAGYNLTPLVCLDCGSHEVTYLQYVGDAQCAECGKWQLEDIVNVENEKSDKRLLDLGY